MKNFLTEAICWPLDFFVWFGFVKDFIDLFESGRECVREHQWGTAQGWGFGGGSTSRRRGRRRGRLLAERGGQLGT